MNINLSRPLLVTLMAVCTVLLYPVAAARAQGIVAPGAGPIQMSMGGASTAVGLDAVGANMWNPAAILGLKQSEVEIANQLAFPRFLLGSQFRGAGGTTQSDSGTVLIPGLALVYRPEDSPNLAFGMSTTVNGGGVNYPGDANNPLLSPTGPLGKFTLGPIYANIGIYEISFNAALQVTDRLSVGAGPVIDMAVVSLDPGFFAPADDANGDGVSTFPEATHSRPFWGGGFKAGMLYRLTDNVSVGFGYTSPQWFEKWIFNSHDELGNARQLGLNASLPAIYSWGVAYSNPEGLTLTTDLRYFDYKDTQLFGPPITAGGLRWNNVFSVAVGAQYALNEKLAVRAGYVYNSEPVPTNVTLFNIQAPAITQHTLSAGFSYRLNDYMTSSLAYAFTLPASQTGTISPFPGTNVTLQASAQSILLGLQIRFGPKTNSSITPAEGSSTGDLGTAQSTGDTAARAPIANAGPNNPTTAVSR
jgi:long-chain fatty acid transport protein